MQQSQKPQRDTCQIFGPCLFLTIDHDQMITATTITNREKEVLNLIAQEYTAKEIAGKLYISYHTADTHRKNLCIKLGARNTAGLVRRAFEIGILTIH